jgi:hypothetical protein
MVQARPSYAGSDSQRHQRWQRRPDDPKLWHTKSGIARAMFRVAVSGRREQEASFFTVVVWRDQAEHAAQSLSKGIRVAIVGPAPAAELDRRGWQRPIHCRGPGRRAGAEPSA